MACVSLHICGQLLPHWHTPIFVYISLSTEEWWEFVAGQVPTSTTLLGFVPCVCELRVLHVNLTMSSPVSFQGGLLLSLWRKAMSTEEGRKMGQKLIADMVAGQKFDLLRMYNGLKRADLAAPSFLRESSSNIEWLNLLADMCLVIQTW